MGVDGVLAAADWKLQEADALVASNQQPQLAPKLSKPDAAEL